MAKNFKPGTFVSGRVGNSWGGPCSWYLGVVADQSKPWKGEQEYASLVYGLDSRTLVPVVVFSATSNQLEASPRYTPSPPWWKGGLELKGIQGNDVVVLKKHEISGLLKLRDKDSDAYGRMLALTGNKNLEIMETIADRASAMLAISMYLLSSKLAPTFEGFPIGYECLLTRIERFL